MTGERFRHYVRVGLFILAIVLFVISIGYSGRVVISLDEVRGVEYEVVGAI